MFARTSRTSLAPALTRLLRRGRMLLTMSGWRAVTASLSLALALAVLGPVATTAQESSDAMDFAAIDGYIAAKMRAPRIPGVALAIVEGDRVVYLKGYGQADPAGQPVTPRTPFVIGSISKPFTALAVMQLVEAGLVELDAPVQRYLPWFRIAGLHLVWPVAVLYLAVAVPLWRVDVGLGQPDLTAWLEAVATVVALKGLLELALTWLMFRQTEQRRSGRGQLAALAAGR